jgi:uncharacterized membrane protein YuzA (DUF378 family)
VDKGLDLLALLLVIVGAVNWGLVGLFEFDLVAALVGEEFGTVNVASRIVYVLVALAGLYLASRLPSVARRPAEVRESYA